MDSPTVSVVLPIYRDERFLDEALSSLDRQTYRNVEVIAVTESLSDRSERALKSVPLSLSRIEYDGKDGLVGALNRGLDEATGKYIARMDADDIARPERLATQVRFLEGHSSVGVVGSGYERIDARGQRRGRITPPRTHLGIRWRLLFTSCIPHPTAVVRAAVLDEHDLRYRPSFDAAEDFDFWTRLADVTTLRNLPEPLLEYRIEGAKKSDRDATRQAAAAARITAREIDETLPGVGFSERQVLAIRRLLYDGASVSDTKDAIATNYLCLLEAFERKFADGAPLLEVRRHAAVTLARALLRPPHDPRSFLLFAQLFDIDAGYPLHLVQFLVRRRLLNRPTVRRLLPRWLDEALP